MLPILFCLFALLDIKQVPITDELLNEFSVMEFDNDTTADCSENPSLGGPMEFQLPKNDCEELPVSEDTNIVLDISASSVPSDTSISVTSRTAPAKPPNPDPDQEPQNPIVVTPEPKPLAILTITGIALICLLFGRNPGRRFFRRV